MASFNRSATDERNTPFCVGHGNTPCRATNVGERYGHLVQLGSPAAICSAVGVALSQWKIEPAEAEPDFSEEFGHARGFAGGEGFENVEFDRWV